MKYWIATALIVIGFAFINNMQPLDIYDIVGSLFMIVGFGLDNQ